MLRIYVVPLFGAYIADTRWGRYKTVCVAVGIALFGHVLLIISAVPGVIEKSHGALACFIIAVIIMGLGTGGFKSNVSPLVAEQYKKSKLFIGNTRSGERVIIDPVMTTSRIYMYFYLFTNIGSLIGQISMSYSEKVCLCALRAARIQTDVLTSITVCWLLARVYTPHDYLHALPNRSVRWAQYVYPLTSSRIGPLEFPPHLAYRVEGQMVTESCHHDQEAERA